MNARSLVGMTMGARKRAARIAILAHEAKLFWADRKLYRIGQRLRPCPGCYLCNARIRDPYPNLPPDACDGSGVLPAKKGAK